MYVDKYMEENRSEDIGCDVVRIFDVDPRKKWPLKINNIVLGGYQLLRMPFVGDDKNRTQYLITNLIIYWSIQGENREYG